MDTTLFGYPRHTLLHRHVSYPQLEVLQRFELIALSFHHVKSHYSLAGTRSSSIDADSDRPVCIRQRSLRIRSEYELANQRSW